jgi:hypothetical protein
MQDHPDGHSEHHRDDHIHPRPDKAAYNECGRGAERHSAQTIADCKEHHQPPVRGVSQADGRRLREPFPIRFAESHRQRSNPVEDVRMNRRLATIMARQNHNVFAPALDGRQQSESPTALQLQLRRRRCRSSDSESAVAFD